MTNNHPTNTPPEVGDRPPVRSRRFLGLRTAAALVGAALGIFVLVLALSNLFPPTSNIVTVMGVLAWAWVGPLVVLLSLLAALLCLPLSLARRRPVLRGVSSGLAIAALLSSSVMTGVLVGAGNGLGGSVDLARATTLSGQPEGPDDVTSYVTVDGEPQEARVFEPGDSENAPVMMYIHGGAWYMGAAADSDALSRSYADQGWYVVSVDYRLSTADNPTWDKAPADVACALSWTALQADSIGADTERLTVMGDSAGGHLAMLLGWSAAAGEATSSCPERGKVPTPDAVVAGYPVSNVEYTYDNGNDFLGIDPQGFTRDFLGGDPSEVPERLAAVSPASYVSDAAPATFVVQPERDDFIPAEGNYRLIEQAQDAGVDATIVSVPLAYHGFDIIAGSIGDQIKSTVAVNWLQEQGLAP